MSLGLEEEEVMPSPDEINNGGTDDYYNGIGYSLRVQ